MTTNPTAARDGHRERADAVARTVRARPAGKKLTVRKNTYSHSVRDAGYKRDCHPVDVSSLVHVLDIDPVGLTATVEGQVNLETLCGATMAFGLLPAVVPEFKSFTVSGLINGEGIQSSSHRYGLFSSTVSWMEIVLGDGSVVEADAGTREDLFRAMPGSHGTLGIVTAARVQLIPAKRWVRSTYRHFTSLQGYVEAFEAALEQTTYMEGLVCGPSSFMLITSEFTDEVGDDPVFRPWAEGGPYYYQHVRQIAAAGRSPVTDVVPTLEYVSRSMRGLWWMAECHVNSPRLMNTHRVRRMIDRATFEQLEAHGFQSGGLLTVEERERCLVAQDLAVKLARLAEGIEYVREHIGIYPLWNCAFKRPAKGGGEEHLVDIGVYGEPTVADYRNRRDMRALQLFVDAPSFWGVCYLTREEIRTVDGYDFAAYERARARYHAEDAFLRPEDKIAWFDPAAPDPGKIPAWRYYRLGKQILKGLRGLRRT
jgi:delta24-sterol reductase